MGGIEQAIALQLGAKPDGDVGLYRGGLGKDKRNMYTQHCHVGALELWSRRQAAPPSMETFDVEGTQ